MSSTEVVASPTKKIAKQKMDQIVSSSDSNGHESDGDNDDESVKEQTIITNPSETNKDCHADACMEPLLIQNCVEDFATNPNNECVLSEDSSPDDVEAQQCDFGEESPTDEGGGGFMKTNLSLNLLSDDKNMPKNKKFLESSDDQIINQIFFSTISVTPTTDDDVLDSKFLSSDNTPLTPNEGDIDPDLLVGPADFFNRKIDEDETFDTTFTDTAENYQENEDGNLCSLNDNFNENYCSFSSIDYNTSGQQIESPGNANDLLQPENFLGDYAEVMRQQRPSIVIDCYDSDSNSDKNSHTEEDVVVGEAKINDYCFYFDQTIEEDDDDACYPNGVDDNFDGQTLDELSKNEIGKASEEVDECFETEYDGVDEDEDALPNEMDDKSLASDEDDEGVVNESCISVNSAVESLESETTVVKKSVKKSVKTSKTTSKKKTISTTESSSITSSKAASFENSFSNGSVEVVEQHHVEQHQTAHQESVTSSKSIDSSSSGKEAIESIHDSTETAPPLENGEKKKLNGKKKSKKSKKSDSEKENISVLPSTVKVNQTQFSTNCTNKSIADHVKGDDTYHEMKADAAKTNLPARKFIMSSSLQLQEDDLSRIDVKSLKQKYSNAIERQSMKSSSVGMNGSGYLGIKRDVSVKHLCRSFGDLTSLNSEEYNSNHFQHVYRDSYCSLIGLTDSSASHQPQQQHPHSLMLHKRPNHNTKSTHKSRAIKLGIKQFDMKSSFSKFDALQKKNMQNLQNGKGEANGQSPELEKKCHACTKVVFQMEQVKAEKKFWHKNCFRCSECSKQLNVDTYQSHEGILYCKPHFKTLFAPKAVEESNEPVKPRKLEMIIRESQPIELPPDVARSSDKADLGLEELQQLNVRQRFQVFENAGQESKVELDKSPGGVKRSTSILSKLARFQAKGMDVGVVDDSLNGICYEHSSSEEEEFDDDENQEDIELIRAKRAQKEKPMSFKEMHDIKSKFENGQCQGNKERREERKQELQNIRSRLFLGKQVKMKEAYQQAVADSEQMITASGKQRDFEASDKAKSIKERFEKGEIFEDGDNRATLKEDEMSVFEQGIGKQSRSLFLELDASAAKSPSIQHSPSSATLNRHTPRQPSQTLVSNDDIVRSDSKMDDVQIETADIVSKFKFFETYKPSEKEKKAFRITPPRDGVAKLPSPESDVYRDPHIARNDVNADQDEVGILMAEQTHTASKMLSVFRQLEEHKEQRPVGPKPLKRFTPPPDSERKFTANDDSGPEYSDSEEDDEECEEEEDLSETELDPNYVKSSHKNVDEFLQAAQSAERAKQLREKFEKWEKNEIKKEMNNSSVNLFEPTTDEGQMETAKSLRARFEQMQQEEPKLPNARVKVNRFV